MNKTMKYQLTQNINQKKYPWIPRDFKRGEIVYRYFGCTYSCISSSGTAVTEEEGENPFFEVPIEFLEKIL